MKAVFSFMVSTAGGSCEGPHLAISPQREVPWAKGAVLRAARRGSRCGPGGLRAGQMPHLAALALAERFGITPVSFPGDHRGFATHPGPFAETVHQALRGSSGTYRNPKSPGGLSHCQGGVQLSMTLRLFSAHDDQVLESGGGLL